jgi:hypothetical protein
MSLARRAANGPEHSWRPDVLEISIVVYRLSAVEGS